MKRFGIMLLTGLLLGCAAKGSVSAPDPMPTKPPALTVSVPDESVPAAIGSYSWMYPNGDGTETGAEACGMAAIDMVDLLTPLPLKDARTVTLTFVLADDQTLNRVTLSGWRTGDAASKESYEKPAFMPAIFMDGNVVTAELPACGSAVYEVHAYFDGAAHGDCYYSFCAVRQAQDVPFTADAVRIGWSEDVAGMEVGVILDDDALANWLSANAGLSRDMGLSFTPISDTFAPYDAVFFADQALLIVPVEAGSGSMRFSVAGVQADETGATVTIRRKVPEVGTSDMAAWLLLVSVPNVSVLPDEPVTVTFFDA